MKFYKCENNKQASRSYIKSQFNENYFFQDNT